MKRLLISLTACGLLITSCAKNEVAENINQNISQFKFGVVTGAATKASEKIAFTNGGSIGLWARSPNVVPYSFDDTLSTSNGTDWATQVPHFAPAGGSVDFLAVWPHNAIEATDFVYNMGNYTFPYTVKSENNQADLMAGVLLGETNGGSKTVHLYHLLSQINFGVYGYNGAEITISNIIVYAVNNTGRYTFTTSNAKGTWNNRSGSVNYGYTIAGGTIPANATTGNKYIFGDGGNWAAGNGKGIYYNTAQGEWLTETALVEEKVLSNSLMLMPQPLIAAYATLQYTIADTKGTIQDEVSFDLNTGSVTEWEQNYRYLYMINFTGFLDNRSNTVSVNAEAYIADQNQDTSRPETPE